jgi:hypothetical protein
MVEAVLRFSRHGRFSCYYFYLQIHPYASGVPVVPANLFLGLKHLAANIFIVCKPNLSKFSYLYCLQTQIPQKSTPTKHLNDRREGGQPWQKSRGRIWIGQP